MKNLMLLIIVLICSISVSNSQNKKKKVIVHKVWVTLMDESKQMGYLYSAKEQEIKITKKNSMDINNLITIDASTIQLLKIRRKGKIGRGVWIGALSGLATGAIIGFLSGDDDPGILSFNAEAKATGLGLTFAVLGSGIGALAGTKKEKVEINGDLKLYKNKLSIIRSYSLISKYQE